MFHLQSQSQFNYEPTENVSDDNNFGIPLMFSVLHVGLLEVYPLISIQFGGTLDHWPRNMSFSL